MIQSGKGSNACFEKCVYELVVEIQTFLICWPPARRLNAWPGDREAVAFDSHLAHEFDVFCIAVVMINGHIPIVSILDFSRSVRETVPNGFAASVLLDCSLNLIRRRSYSPNEVLRECHRSRRERKGTRFPNHIGRASEQANKMPNHS